MNNNPLAARKERIADFLIVLLCLSSAAFFINLFRLDLFRTINTWDDRKPVGIIVIREHIVQRRLKDRFLWDRLFVQSPVFLGDLIRVAELSAATLYFDDDEIELYENTLIRVERSSQGEGSFEIELSEGGMSLHTQSRNMTINVNGRIVQVWPRTVLNADVGEDGLSIQVSEGAATLTGDNFERELSSGTMIELDERGIEKTRGSVMVTQPVPNARYLKTGALPLDVDFSWVKVNFETGEALRLEIAGDWDFAHVVEAVEKPGNEAKLALDAGLWYWRLSNEDAVFSRGQIAVLEASVPVLISPAKDSLIRLGKDRPPLCFQWSDIPEAVSYVLEASSMPDFADPAIRRQTAVTSLVDSSLGQGKWYWRVRPIYPPVYKGIPAFTPASAFSIEYGEETEAPVWILPAPAFAEALVDTAPVQALAKPLVDAIPAPAIPTDLRIEPIALPVPVLPAPLVQPLPMGADNRIGIQELKVNRKIDFKWSAVPGANAYIFSLFQEVADGRHEILRSEPINRTEWTLDDISILDRGVLVWQVEAVSIGADGIIKQRGSIEENTFTLDIPVPGEPTMLRLE